jgi:hypothetical protein
MAIGDLFRPKWKHSRATVRISAVANLADLNIVADIAQHDTDPSVRTSAVEKLSNPQVLQRIVQRESDANVWQVALARINDQSTWLKSHAPSHVGRCVRQPWTN